MQDSRLNKLLDTYGLQINDLINEEPYYYEHGKGILERFEKGEADFNEVERFVRVIVTNQLMQSKGLTPLIPHHNMTIQKKRPAVTISHDIEFSPALDKNEELAMNNVGLSKEEYASVRGEGGQILGLNFKSVLYRRLFKVCGSKKAMALASDMAASKDFITQKIKRLAQNETAKKRLKINQLGDLPTKISRQNLF